MICDGFRIPVFFPTKNNNQVMDGLQILKIDKKSIDEKSSPVLNIKRDSDHYFYINKNNDYCIIDYDCDKTQESYNYKCKITDSTIGVYEESVIVKNDFILLETYNNEKPIFYYERNGKDSDCVVNGKSAQIIQNKYRLIIIDDCQNYFVFKSVYALPNRIIEEGMIDSCGNFIPTLKYKYIGDDMISIENFFNKNYYMIYLQ